MRRCRFGLVLVVAALLGALLAVPAHAHDFTVDNTGDQPDAIPGDQFCASDTLGCTLRAAVEEANAFADDGHTSPDTISVPAGTYALEIGFGGALEITSDISITGAGPRGTIIKQERDDSFDVGDRVFDIQGSGSEFQIANVTIADGRAQDALGFFGGNIRSEGTLTITGSTLVNGRASSGGALANNGGTLKVVDSTLSGNQASDGGGDAGAILNFGTAGSAASLTVQNSTIHGNSARLAGGIFSYNSTGNSVSITNSTVTGNASGDRGGGGGLMVNDGTASINTTIVADNTSQGPEQNCTGTGISSSGDNIESATDCGFTGAGDQQNTGPDLGSLQDNGGGTDTRAPSKTSPARDAASSCLGADQRGVSRPQGPACDIGSVELVPGPPPVATTGAATDVGTAGARLTGVVNPQAESTTYHFRYGTTTGYGSQTRAQDAGMGDADVPVEAVLSGLQPNTTYHYRLVATSPGGETSGADRTFTTAAESGGTQTPPPAGTSQAGPKTLADLPPPVLGKQTNVEPAGGTVLVGIPGSAAGASHARAAQKGVRFVPLREARQIPVGSFLDTRRGTVRLQTAAGGGKRQTGEFSRGLFQVLQSRRRSARGLTELRLKGSSFRRCRTGSKRASTALSRRRIRRLRGNARGRFRTRGRYSAATVRGTDWTTVDRCDGTLTTVRRGRVVVRDFRRKRNVLLRAGKRYLARAPR